jgi:glycosyltransferase involved in cell wall biosynthesis
VKVLYLHQYFNTPDMAGGTRSYEIARRLVAHGHEVHMITSWRQPTERKGWFEQQVDGIHVHWLPVPYSNHMSFRERIEAFSHFALNAGKRAISLGGDVIFATSTPLTIAIPGVQAKRRLRIPMVFEVRDLWPELPIAIGELRNPFLKAAARLLEKYAYRNSECIVALSDGMADGIVSCGYPREQVHVIPNSSDLALFSKVIGHKTFRSKIQDIENRPLITYAGTLGTINGVGYLVDIAAAATKIAPQLRFAIVGEGKEEEFVRQRATTLGVLGSSLFMFPSVSKAEMPDVFAGSDVAISLFIDLEPMWANSANKFFDALAAGKPVAINYGGWQAKVLEKCGAGIRLPANDPMLAARMLADWTTDRAILQKGGIAARQLAEEFYDRDKLSNQLETVLLTTIQNGGGKTH